MARLPGPHLPVVLSVFLSSLGSMMDTLAASLHFILGSGGLSIGQAGEFDYSGSQVR